MARPVHRQAPLIKRKHSPGTLSVAGRSSVCAMVASTAALEFFLRLYLGHLAEAARAGRDAVALYGASGTPRLTFALAVALIRHAVPPRDCGT